MSTLIEAAAACCACLRVHWRTTPGPDGTVSGRWACTQCAREFVRGAELESLRDQGAEAFDAYSAAYDSVSDELRVVTRERDDARRNLSTSRTTCAYCEAVHELPCTFESIREHIEACPKHPLAAARAAIFEAIDRHQVASARANKLEQERDELLAAVRSLLPLAEACARSRERLDMPLGAVEARETVSAAEALLAREGP